MAPGPLGPGGLGLPLTLVLAKKGNTPPLKIFFGPPPEPKRGPLTIFRQDPLFGEPPGATGRKVSEVSKCGRSQLAIIAAQGCCLSFSPTAGGMLSR